MDFTLDVRQISQYPPVLAVGPLDVFLLQQGGLGGPFVSVTREAFLTGTTGIAVGLEPAPAQAPPGFVLEAGVSGVVATFLTTMAGQRQGFNWYTDANGFTRYLGNGLAGQWSFDQGGLSFAISPSGRGNDPIPAAFWTRLLRLTVPGVLEVAQQVRLGRPPGEEHEAVTLGFLNQFAVTTFNGRSGQVCLNALDVNQALDVQQGNAVASMWWVDDRIAQALQEFYLKWPFVTTFNGRHGTVVLTACDVSSALFADPLHSTAPSPPLGDDSNRIATTAFVTEGLDDLDFATSQDIEALEDEILADLTKYALLDSPNFIGIPTAPTAAAGTSTGQLATTAFVMNAIAGSVAGVTSFNGRGGAVVLLQSDIVGAGGWASPILTGTPTAPTPAPADNSQHIATTAFVQGLLTTGAVTSFDGRTGAVTLNIGDITGAGGAPLASPVFTGVPSAPTAAPGTSTTQLATTAFVQASVGSAAGVSSFNGRTGAVTLVSNDISAAGGALLASPVFTGVPAAPTAAPGTATTQLATTAFVSAALAAATAGVSSFNGRTGAVTLTVADITGAGGAPINSPAFTGTPTAPTLPSTDNSTSLATTAFVKSVLTGASVNLSGWTFSLSGGVSVQTATGNGSQFNIGSGIPNNLQFRNNGGGVVLTVQDNTSASASPSNYLVVNNNTTGQPSIIKTQGGDANRSIQLVPNGTGTVQAPTMAPGDSSTAIATTAFVQSAITGGAGGFQIGDVLLTTRGNPTGGGQTWLACDGTIYTSATYPTLQGYLGNKFAQFGTFSNNNVYNAYSIMWSSSINLFIAVGSLVSGGNAAIATSPDGTTWTTRDSLSGIYQSGVAQSGTRLVVVNQYGTATRTSTNGTTWAAGGNPGFSGSDSFVGLAAGGTSNLFVLAGSGQTTTLAPIFTSPDGAVWTPRTNVLGSGIVLGSVACSPTLCVIAAASANLYMTSPDGITWTSRTGPWGNVNNIIMRYLNGNFIVTINTNSVWVSSDGINWTQYNIPPLYVTGGSTWPSVQINGFDNPLYVFFDSINYTLIMTPDFHQWHYQNVAPVASIVLGAASSSGIYSAAGQNVGIFTGSFSNTSSQFRVPNMNNMLYAAQQIPAYIRAL